MNSSSDKPNKKLYSKLGCRECKRRKIKCDETKPLCLKCSRLDKVCVYPKLGEKVLRVSKKYMAEHPDLNGYDSKKVSDSLSSSSKTPSQDLENPSPVSNPPHHLPQQVQPQHISPQSSHANLRPHSNQIPIRSNSIAVPSPDPRFIYGPPGTSPGSTNLPLGLPHIQPNHQMYPIPPTSYPFPPLPQLAALHPSSTPSQYRAFAPPVVASPPAMLVDQETTRNTSPISKSSNHSGIDTNPSSNNQNQELTLKGDMLFDSYFNREDLNLLASDLNSLVGSIMVESNLEQRDDLELASVDSASTSHVSPPSIPIMRNIYSNNTNSNKIPRNLPHDFIKVKNSLEKFYLEQFFHNFACIILPFGPYDESVGGYFNPARDIIVFCATKEPLLLAAILAQGAKVAHNKTNYPKHEEAYCNYLLKCLKLLGPALNADNVDNNNVQTKKKLASNLESVLITVLLLTSANASNNKQNWRSHLKGAKDLLLKYSIHSELKESKIMIFCKVWFCSFELLAGLSSPKGGTLQSDAELDSIMKLDDPDVFSVLEEMELVNKDGYNYIFGFHHNLLPVFKDLIKFLNSKRQENTGISPFKDTFYIVGLLSRFYELSNTIFINKLPYLSPKDFDQEVIPDGVLLDVETLKGKTVIINWADMVHQAYCLAGMITVLTKGLGLDYDNEQVKPMTTKLVEHMAILEEIPVPKFGPFKTLMIQWPMLVAGLNCFEEKQKSIVEQFFRISGAGSAAFSIRIIDKVWDKRKNGGTDESDLDVDVVTY